MSGIRTILGMPQIQTGVRLVCSTAPSPALSLLQDPRGILLEALPLFLEERSISLVIPGGQDAFSNSERLGH